MKWYIFGTQNQSEFKCFIDLLTSKRKDKCNLYVAQTHGTVYEVIFVNSSRCKWLRIDKEPCY